MIQGHAIAIVEAGRARVGMGTHFAAVAEEGVELGARPQLVASPLAGDHRTEFGRGLCDNYWRDDRPGQHRPGDRREMGYRILRLVAISIPISLLALVSALSVAGATRKLTITSHLTIQGKGLKFSGRVTASNPACQSSRRVTLYRKLSNGSGQSLASTVTSSSGSWKITASGSAGITMSHFYATVKRRSEGTAGTIYICTAATSKTIPYKP